MTVIVFVSNFSVVARGTEYLLKIDCFQVHVQEFYSTSAISTEIHGPCKMKKEKEEILSRREATFRKEEGKIPSASFISSSFISLYFGKFLLLLLLLLLLVVVLCSIMHPHDQKLNLQQALISTTEKRSIQNNLNTLSCNNFGGGLLKMYPI